MSTLFQTFRDLHYASDLLPIGNVWNVESARLFESGKWKAIATSSAAVAESLGYEDDQSMPFDDYLFIIRRISKSVSIPLSVDMENGYGETTEQVAANIKKLVDAGVSGINFEDSVVKNGKRVIENAQTFTQRLNDLTSLLSKESIDIFINVRCDAFLLGVNKPVEEAVRRATLYQATGVHGLFFPCVTDRDDMAQLTTQTQLPVSVMCMPGLPGFDELEKAGVKRVSFGPFGYRYAYAQLAAAAGRILEERHFGALF